MNRTARPRLLDLYCCQGGATKGYQDAGYIVTGVDLAPQPRYVKLNPDFHQGDAIEFLLAHGSEFDFIHASPPCQLDSDCQRIMDREHPDLIGPTREALEAVGVPYVIENVAGARAKLRQPVELCGLMFGLTRTYRHRYFETGGGWSLPQPHHPRHEAPQAKMGRRPQPGEFIQAVGNFSGVAIVRDEWGVGWMNRDGIREAIPPAYAEWIGGQFLAAAGEVAA
ncbi:SAM-dependent methyltransferase [Streptomyces sp. NPDC094149]|uniref:SAM-dependent methyltransferase n=1 Tax=Streptomyces sp. NPDC094149 TaxID=3155079 RepID=UPI003329C17A